MNIWQKLREPFPLADLEWRAGQGGLVLPYISARAAMDRLDDVLGPENWKDTYEWIPGPDGWICELSFRIPDTDNYDWITKCDGSPPSNIEDFKGGISGAFKRACVKLGIGRYLYSLPKYHEQPRTLPTWALPTPQEVIRAAQRDDDYEPAPEEPEGDRELLRDSWEMSDVAYAIAQQIATCGNARDLDAVGGEVTARKDLLTVAEIEALRERWKKKKLALTSASGG